MAKKFFYVSCGVLMLALAYHFGAATATAQAPGNPIVSLSYQNGFAMAATANGEVYSTSNVSSYTQWTHVSNVFAGGSTPTEPNASWGQVKARYR